MTIYIGNLSYDATQDNLEEVFAAYGIVKKINVPTDRKTKSHRGFAFVDLGAEAEEEKAIAELDGAVWMGRTLKVKKATHRENKN